MTSALATAGVSSASVFVEARRKGICLTRYPGVRPTTLRDAYRIQDEAIDLWPAPVGGWKVGRINAPWDTELGTDRLVGPIFADQIFRDVSAVQDMPVFPGGFAAVEGEFVLVLGEDADAGKTTWSPTEALRLVETVRVGIEVASSPYAKINDEGPLVTISDFGNNAGLLLGAELANWRALRLDEWSVQVRLASATVGEGLARELPGGPLASLAAALGICAQRGRPMKRGMAVSTGAVSGVHQAQIGQTAEVVFPGVPSLECRIVAARPYISTRQA